MAWSCDIPELEPAHLDLLHVLRTAVAGCVPDEPPADWAAVLELARLHQVDHYLYPIVHTWAPSCQPGAPLMARWRNSFLGAAAQYTRASVQAAELLTALHAAQVRVVPLKGVWLAERIYEDGACRPMCDIDLLVPPAELDRARAAFEHLGYVTTDYYMSVERDKHVRYQRVDGVLPVELHWRLWSEGKENIRGEPDLERIWSGLSEEFLLGVPVQTFPPERKLIYLTQHILHHTMMVPLRAYLDLILLCRRYAPQLDFSCLETEAYASQVLFGAKFVLQVAFDICGVCPPASVTSFLTADGAFEEERRAALSAALQLTDESRQLTSAMAACRRASWPRRLRLGLSRIFLPPDMIRAAYAQAVRRYGLAGGYIARCADLIRRRGRVWRTVGHADPALSADLANFNTRRALGAWIHAQDGR